MGSPSTSSPFTTPPLHNGHHLPASVPPLLFFLLTALRSSVNPIFGRIPSSLSPCITSEKAKRNELFDPPRYSPPLPPPLSFPHPLTPSPLLVPAPDLTAEFHEPFLPDPPRPHLLRHDAPQRRHPPVLPPLPRPPAAPLPTHGPRICFLSGNEAAWCQCVTVLKVLPSSCVGLAAG